MASTNKNNEGYQIFQGDKRIGVVVKQEPVDSGYVDSNTSNGDVNLKPSHGETADGGTRDVREALKQILIARKDKELTVKTVVDDLLQSNHSFLEQLRGHQTSPIRSKPADSTDDFVGILNPKDPTISCSLEDLSENEINGAIVETGISDSSQSNFELDLVCAVGSRVKLKTAQGQTLQLDSTFYWCNFCNYKSDKKDALVKHVIEHRFLCRYCKFRSFSRAEVIHHCSTSHEEFQEVTPIFKYCTFLPDILQRSELQQNKRKRNGESDGEEGSKKSRYDEIESLSMEVDEVNEGEEVSTTSEDKIIIPRVPSSRKTLPAPVKPSSISSYQSTGDMTSVPQIASTETPGVMLVSSKKTPQKEEYLPIISSVVSGKEAVEQAVKHVVQDVNAVNQAEPGTSRVASTAEDVTVASAGLCWNCGYCSFITFSQSFLRMHLNGNHQGKPHKYVALLINSKERVDKIKQSDANMQLNVNTAVEVPTTKHVDILPAPSLSENSNIPVAKVQVEVDEVEETEEEKKIAVTYKCAHCNHNCPEVHKVKEHLKTRHIGCVMYVLDMKAVKLRKRRYLYFCLMDKCNFTTKDGEEFMEHQENCKQGKMLDDITIKSLNLTKAFINKSASSSQPQSTATKSDKTAEYGCPYCIYLSNNNTRLKKHVISNHQHMPTVIKNQNATSRNAKTHVNFCRHCLWETREDNELGKHLSEHHNDKSLLKSDKDKGKMAEEQHKASGESGSNKKSTPVPSNSLPQGSVDATPQEESSSKHSTSDNSRSSMESEDKDSDYQEEELTVEDKYPFVGKAEIGRAKAAYVDSVSETENKGRPGRPARNAARKAQIKNKFLKPPPLYRCFHCKDHIAFGIPLMKAHINQTHKGKSLKAYDRFKLEHSPNNALVCICPSDKCTFSASFATDVVNHAKWRHGMQPTCPALVALSSYISVNATPHSRKKAPATPATGETYECLYCTDSSLMYYSRLDMKTHLKYHHPTEEYIFRDCIARKLRQQSRYYMCHNLSCDQTFSKQTDYKLHCLAHDKSMIFECPKCSWFSKDPSDFKAHGEDEHEGEKLNIIKVDLDLDSVGNVMRLINGTLIKAEKF